MTKTPWDALLADEDRSVISKGGFGRRIGFGQRPAVVVIDAQNYMFGEPGADADWPSSCGEDGRKALAYVAEVVQVAQSSGVPCFFTLFELDATGSDMGVYGLKRDLLRTDHWCLAGTVGARLVDVLHPGPADIVMVKKKPSGFHGTPLLGHLIDRQIDTVIVMGGSTSNCIRATVIDSASHNFRTIVPQEAVFDRIQISHAISLSDMDRQLADVVSTQAVIPYLRAQAVGRAIQA